MSLEETLILRMAAVGAAATAGEVQTVRVEVERLGTGAGKTGVETEKASKKMGLFHRSLSAFKSIGPLLGLGAIAYGIKDIIGAGQKWEAQTANLKVSLKNAGVTGKGALKDIIDEVEKLSTKGGFAGPEQLSAISNFVRIVGSESKALKLNQAAMELARGAHIGFTQAQRIMQQALTGQVSRLQRYIGIIEPVKTHVDALHKAHAELMLSLSEQSKAMGKAGPIWLKHQQLIHAVTSQETQRATMMDRQATATKTIDLVTKKFGGSMAAYSKTASGAISNLGNRFDTTAKNLSIGLNPVVRDLANLLSGLLGFIGSHVKLLTLFAGAFLAVRAAMVLQAGAATLSAVSLGPFSLAETAAMYATYGLSAALDLMPWFAVVAAIVFVILHFKQFKQIVGAIWSWLKTAVADTVGWVAGHWKLLALILLGPFAWAVAGILLLFKTSLPKVISGVIGWLQKVWSPVGKLLSGPFSFAWKIIQTVFNAVVGATKWLVKEVGKLLGKILGPLEKIGGFFGKIGGGILKGAGGLSKALFGWHGGPVPRHMAAGGPIGPDTIPMWAAPGEFVIRADAAKKIGQPALQAANNTGRFGADEVPLMNEVFVSLVIGDREFARAVQRSQTRAKAVR